MRVLNRTVRQISEDYYLISAELGATGVAAPTDNFLIAFGVSSAIGMEDLSTHGWTPAFWSGDFCAASVIACGAGPPVNQGMGMYYRAIVSGETATVAGFKPDTGSNGGMWVYEVAGCDMNGISTVHSNQFLADGATVTVSASASEASVLFGGVGFGKVNYDSGWCTGFVAGGELVTDAAGTELVNKSALNDCSGAPCPWSWIAYTTGTGTLSISANADSAGAGGGAYSCGYNVGKGGLLIPAPGGFSIVQSAFGGTITPGAPFNVTLPSPPTP